MIRLEKRGLGLGFLSAHLIRFEFPRRFGKVFWVQVDWEVGLSSDICVKATYSSKV